MLEAPCAEPLWATFCSTASVQGSGAPSLQPTAPSGLHDKEREPQLGGLGCQENHRPCQSTHPRHGPTDTPWMLSHSHGCYFPQQPCSSTQGSLSLVVRVTVQPRPAACIQHNRDSKLNEILQ